MFDAGENPADAVKALRLHPTADLEEGWSLLPDVSRVKLGGDGLKGGDSTVIGELDAWENRWFPIASATLERRFPAVKAQIFKNLTQTECAAVAVSVRTFIERYDAMVSGAGTYGPEGTAAKDVLAGRGLTTAVVDHARALLEKVSKVSGEFVGTTADEDKKQLADAEAKLWAWYLEWSQIARVAVTQRALLKQMGFVATRPSKPSEDEQEDGEGEGEGPSTQPAIPVSPVTPIA